MIDGLSREELASQHPHPLDGWRVTHRDDHGVWVAPPTGLSQRAIDNLHADGLVQTLGHADAPRYLLTIAGERYASVQRRDRPAPALSRARHTAQGPRQTIVAVPAPRSRSRHIVGAVAWLAALVALGLLL